MAFSFSDYQQALVVGAGHGIGQALCEELLENSDQAMVHASYRNSDRAQALFGLKERFPERLQIHPINPTSEEDIVFLKDSLFSHSDRLDLLINAVGMLHNEQIQPEKNLREIDPDVVLSTYLVNAVVTPMLAKHFFPMFKNPHPATFVSISAKVGSIGDNELGGWYSYRASKAALNMFIKNIAIEMDRYRCQTRVLAIHPGTTDTELSKPFTKNTKYQLHTPRQTAQNIFGVLHKTDLSANGRFYSWDGSELPW